MAEGFFRAYASDLMEVHSAGMYPAIAVPAETCRVMLERNIDISEQFPKALSVYPPGYFDLVINMSGCEVSGHENVIDWDIEDPYRSSEKNYRRVRDEIERLILQLIQDLRAGRPPGAARGIQSAGLSE